jgi:nudix-type nucleoside diphosphatase (YffH/AdpP family)
MTARPPAIIDERVVHDGWSRFRIVRVRTSDGTVLQREVEDHGPAVAVLPYDAERRVATLVTQMRPPIMVATGDVTLTEVPAGLLEDGEDPADCARREAMEEAGLRLGTLEPLGALWPMPGLSTERMHLFLAAYTQADRVADGGGLAAEHEDIVVEERSLASLAAALDGGALTDMKTVVLLLQLRHRRPDLFA